MKKKIILFLSFLMVAMCLTGCSTTTIEGTELEKIAEIANHVVNEKDYTLPEGYTISYPDNTTNGRIEIKKEPDQKGEKYNLYIRFDTSQDEIKITEIEIFDGDYLYSPWIGIILIFAGIGAIVIVLFITAMIIGLLKKLNQKLENKNKELKKKWKI